jgi:hypothetical protein
MDGGIRLIEKIHYYLCYQKHLHIHPIYLEEFKKQRNIIYYTSRISRMISRYVEVWGVDLRNCVYFIAYLLCIKYLLDVELYDIKSIYKMFNINIKKRLDVYEYFCLYILEFNFSFLDEKIDHWNIY